MCAADVFANGNGLALSSGAHVPAAAEDPPAADVVADAARFSQISEQHDSGGIIRAAITEKA